jgi:hypothetical protein
MPLLHLNGINKPTPKQLYEYSRIATAEKLALVVTLFMTLTLAVLSSMNPNKSSTQQQISDIVDYYAELESQSIPGKAVFHSPSLDGYPKYLDRENDPYCRLKRPNPPTPEMVQRAQPYRADTLQELEAVIKYPAKSIDV